MQGLLGDWRSQFSGYQPPAQQPVPPNLQTTMVGQQPMGMLQPGQQQGYQTPAYGLSPEFIGLLGQQFPGMNFGADQQGTFPMLQQQLQGLLAQYQRAIAPPAGQPRGR